MPNNLLLTGPPGIGKTTIIRKVVQILGPRAGGFFTEEVRQKGKRIGFRLVTLDGNVAWLARANWPSHYRVGRYGVDVEALEQVGVQAIWKVLVHNDVIIVDEIGRMELASAAFVRAVDAAMYSSKPLVATIMSKSHPTATLFKSRSDVELWTVTMDTRDRLPSRVLDWITQRLPRQGT